MLKFFKPLDVSWGLKCECDLIVKNSIGWKGERPVGHNERRVSQSLRMVSLIAKKCNVPLVLQPCSLFFDILAKREQQGFSSHRQGPWPLRQPENMKPAFYI